MDSVKVKLDLIKFYNLEDIKIGTAFYLDIYDLNKNSVSKNFLKILHECFVYKYQELFCSEKSFLFFFSSEHRTRKEHKNSFDLVKLTCNNKSLIEYKRNKLNFSFIFVFYSLLWLYQMKDTGLSLKEKTYIIPYLIEISKIIKKLKKKTNHFIGLVVLCDVHVIDNSLVQYFNNKKIITISLQHGVYSSRFNTSVITASNSNYLLCYGEFTINECVKLGMDKNKLIPVGMPQLINKKIKWELCLNNNKIIGLIFDGASFIDNDLCMFRIVDEYASNYNYKINIKLHPGTSKDKYNFHSFKNIKNIYYDNITIKEFVNDVDLIVCCISTVFLECLIEMKPVFLYKCSRFNIFYNILWCQFNTSLELESKIDFYLNNQFELQKMLLSTREYLMCITDIKDRYKSFFDLLKDNIA